MRLCVWPSLYCDFIMFVFLCHFLCHYRRHFHCLSIPFWCATSNWHCGPTLLWQHVTLGRVAISPWISRDIVALGQTINWQITGMRSTRQPGAKYVQAPNAHAMYKAPWCKACLLQGTMCVICPYYKAPWSPWLPSIHFIFHELCILHTFQFCF